MNEKVEVISRVPGPHTPNGFPTFSGRAGEQLVHWIGPDEKAVSELEERFKEASSLLRLQLRNLYTIEGLSPEELDLARSMIETARETALPCGAGCRRNAVGDTGLCRYHNRYTLEYRV